MADHFSGRSDETIALAFFTFGGQRLTNQQQHLLVVDETDRAGNHKIAIVVEIVSLYRQRITILDWRI